MPEGPAPYHPGMRWPLLLLLLAGCADPPALAVGQQVDGTLSDGDERIHAGAVVDVVRVRVEAGQPAAVLVSSDDLAPFVIVAAPGGPLGASSGVAAGPPACVSVEAPHALDLLVYVSSAGGASYGGYRVAVAPYTEALAAAHACRAGAPDGHPETDEPTFTAGSRPAGDQPRPSAV